MNQTNTKISFQHRLDENFQKYRDHVAIENGDCHITYSQLESKSNCIYRWITGEGIQPESFIGICLDDTSDIIPVMIGILKARCVFTILDTALPRQRLLNMIRLTHLKIIFAGAQNKKMLFGDGFENSVTVIEADELFYRTGDALPLPCPQPGAGQYNREDKIYIYFTSGSTGMPKAIVGKNKSLLHFIDWEIETFGIDKTFRFSQWITPGFDAFLRDVFTPLCAGAMICIPPRKLLEIAGYELIHWLNARHICLIHCVPSIFRLINIFTEKDAAKENFKALKMVVMSGEKINPHELSRWFGVFEERIQLINLYGPTETTMTKTYYFIGPADGERPIVPVGKPMPGARILILDEDMQPCPKKFIGEIYIRTPFGTYGYYNDPQANKDKFIPNPFTNDAGDLLHKTGDLGRLLDDGNIEVLRRVDRQLKIRGVRVEPEEIENILIKHPAVAEVAVTGKKNSAGEVFLCAYFVPRQAGSGAVATEDITAGELGNYLAVDLPPYMIPAFFIPLDKMPLTPNGKIDIMALPELRLEQDHYIPPANEIEKKLTVIWSQVLDVDRDKISMDANFFRMGGHSLNAAILTSMINHHLAIKVPLAEIFKTPSIRGLAHYINTAALTENSSLSIEPVETREYYPLSPAQGRLYFLQQMDPHGIAYNMPMVQPLGNSIDTKELESTLKKLIALHETLRTSFIQVGDKPFQKVHDQVAFEMEYYDLATGGTGGTEEKIQHLIHSFVRPFDLSRAPLLRSGVIRMPNGDYTWLADIHHIVTDGTSQIILIEDFFALSRGRELAPLPLQYKDFSQWQNRLLESGAIKAQQEYWLSLLTGEIPRLDLPVDYERPDTFTFAGANYMFALDREDAQRFRELGNSVGATLYMNILAVLNVLFHKYTGQTDIIIGSGIAGRLHENLQDIVGMFINILAMRNHPVGEKPYEYFLKEVTANSIKSFENQDVQFEDLVEKLDIQRDLSRNPMLDIFMVVQNFREVKEIKKSRQAGITVENPPQFQYKKTTSKFDLTFFVNEREDYIHITIEYYTGIFKEVTIRRLASHFKTIVKNVIKIPYIILKDIDILSEEEKQRVLQEFNDTARDYPADKTIHQLFEEQAEQSPDRIALVGHVGLVRPVRLVQLSYCQLNEQSNQLAGLLVEKGVLADNIVGIMMERSVEMIIGILGILKSGGAYLPIDPEYPQERIDYMLKDSGAKILLTAADCVFNFHHSSFIIHHSSHLAYLIYTSGSTGKPKGVMVEHGSIFNTIYYRRQEYKMGVDDRALQMFSFAFDGFLTSFFTPLVSGVSVVLLSGDEAKDIARIKEIIITAKITHFICVPSLYRALLDIITGKELAHLKVVALAGEQVQPDLVEKSKHLSPRLEVVNEYGPTESSVLASIHRDIQPGAVISIGKPIANAGIYILDNYENLVPIGIPGQLAISGKGLARGYLNNPALTSEKFIRINKSFWGSEPADLFSKRSLAAGGILYRTGDLARWFPDGNLEFLGRMDNQVKIRGYRIELGEIENCLLKVRGVKEAVVLGRREEGGNSYLCAYIVSDRELGISGLRDSLLKELPDYMIPSYFVPMEKIPLLSNGKVDRGALPGPGGISLREDVGYTLPSSAVEKKLVEIWEKVLGRNNIGINENFFMIGGDSIKSIQIISRMNRAGYKLEMKNLFKYPTISQLAPYVTKQERIPDQIVITGAVPLTPIQQRFFLQAQAQFDHFNHFNQAVMFYSKEGFDKEIIRKVFAKIQEHHDALRMTYEINKENREIIQIAHGVDYPLSLEEYEINGPTGDLELLAERMQAGIDLEKGPLLKLGLFHLDDGDRLLIVIHHLVIDGVSWRILFEDIETLYSRYKRDEKPVLPPKTDSFKLWSETLSAYANSKAFLKEKTYWQQIESVETFPIPRDFEVEGNYIKDTGSVSFILKEEETELLLTRVNGIFRTEINDILLTALGMGIKKTFDHERVSIALEAHGREEILAGIDISRTVGWFTALYPVLINMSYADDPGRQVKEVKETLRRIPNKGIGYGILKYLTREEHKKEIEFKLKPQISFNYLGQFDADVRQLSSFEPAKESPGNSQGPNNKREYLLDVSGLTANNRLTMTITFNKTHFTPGTTATLLSHFEFELKGLIAYCSSWKNSELTPADFTYKGLSIETIDRLTALYPDLEDLYTLTPMQEGMLFHTAFDHTVHSYFEQTSYRLQGDLNIGLVEKSLHELLKRHDILRTAFVYNDIERPVQVVLKERTVDFYFEDIRNTAGKENYIDEFKAKDRGRPFALGSDSLMRVAILRTAEAEYEFIWSFHHILMDGWCLGIINSEFFEIYNSFLENRPYRLAEVRPYRTYIQWLEEQDKDASARYWENYLDAFEEQVEVPGKKIFAKENNREYRNERVSVVLDREKTARLNKLAAGNHATLNTVTQAIWAILLGKYNGKEDVLFGAVVSGRPHGVEGVESMVGLFINTIPVRIRYEANMKFNRLVQKVQEQAIASEPYHYHPLAEIQGRTSLKQNLIGHIMIFENYPLAEQIEGYGKEKNKSSRITIKIANVSVFEQTNYDFNIALSGSDRLTITFQYNGNVYDGDYIARAAKHFSRIVDRVSENPGLEVRELTPLTAEEKNRILYEFNDTETEYPQTKTIHQLFAEQASRTPDHIALVGHVGLVRPVRLVQLSYFQLNEQSNRLAGGLIEKGVQADNIVGIMMQRSVEMIIGILGILKSGGAYMPIDPEYPQERIDYMLKDSGAKILLTAADCVFNFHHSSFIIHHSSHLAYLIYTSGTTGKPKGVAVMHRGVVNYISWRLAAYGFSEKDVTLQLLSYTFDGFGVNLYSSLLSGGKLVIVPGSKSLDFDYIKELVNDSGVTNTSLTPGIYGALLDISRGEQLESLRFVVLAGEKSSADLIEKSLEKAPRLKLYNEYGPTETTIAAAANLQLDSSNTAIIGKPIANAGIYIIDNYENLTPIGIPGQLAISGKGLARGYLNNPELTNDKFKADFHHSSFIIHHSILYCTGDLAQWLPDGNIEFLGRIDQQVKIRGFRIELGEIEGRLAKHPGIKEAVVLMQEEVKEKGDKYLCAYVVSDDESVISQLREYLLKELPDYMIPSYFVPLEKIPLTPNGKVNREALPKPGLKIGESYRAPRNEIEMKLVEIWAEILGRDELPASQLKNSIGIDDNFFQLGGHSLKAIRLVSVLQKDFEVSLTDIFRHQTISSLAEILSYKKNTLQQKIAELKHRGKQKIDAQELMKAKEKFDSQQQSYREKIEKYRNIDFSERVTYRSILLTGATGYLGIHILKELLINCRAQIYLLIRGKNQEEAEQRLLHKIKFYFNETMYDTYRSRIHIVNGDIASDRFELSQAGYNRLAEEIDCVINPAAIVKHYGFYNDFLQVNVEGVRRLIEFAITGKKKDLNHISTLSVGSGKIKEQEFALFSEFDHNFNHHMDNHYVQTKIMAEELIEEAREKGLNTSIFRVGNLVFQSGTGRFQENIEDNAFYSILQSFLKIGIMIDSDQPMLDFSFIDQTGKTVALLFDRQALRGETHHLLNPNKVSLNQLAVMLSELGECLRTAPADEFLDLLQKNYEHPHLKKYIEKIILHTHLLSNHDGSFIDMAYEKTDLILSRLGFYWPRLNKKHVEKMLSYCKEVGFI